MISMIEQANRGRSNQYPIGQYVNRERPNQYLIGPQLAQPPSLGYKRPESQKMKQRRGGNKCVNVGRLDTLRENVQNGKESIGKLFP
jgi:hypothetical protein